MHGDEQLLRGWVYGFEHDASDLGPRPWQTNAALVGGPPDGLLLDITGRGPEQADVGAALPSRGGGQAAAPVRPATRASGTPGPGVMCHFHYSGDTP